MLMLGSSLSTTVDTAYICMSVIMQKRKETFLFTPLHPELFNFKLLHRPWSHAQELSGLEGESIAVTQAPQETLLVDQDGSSRPASPYMAEAGFFYARQSSLSLLPLTSCAGNVQHLPVSGVIFVSQLALGCPGCGAVRC